jgi:hypothetical protein
MSFGVTETLKLTSTLVALALLVQNLEFWRLRPSLEPLGLRFGPRVFSSLLVFQFVSLLPPLFSLQVGWAPTSLLFVSTLLISVHFRGRFAGGADSMGLVVLSGLCVATWWPEHASIALIYIGVQSTLSYVIAGAAKALRRRWRSGEALPSFVRSSSPYDVPQLFATLFENRFRAQAASWALILFELSLVPALFDSKSLQLWILCAIAFHALNFVAFGLNRFWWIWIATYPALLYLSQTL